jgi:hypothetical protein
MYTSYMTLKSSPLTPHNHQVPILKQPVLNSDIFSRGGGTDMWN